MIYICYLFIAAGIFFNFIMWRVWKNHDKIIEHFGMDEAEFNLHMKSLLIKTMLFYGLAVIIKMFL